MIKIALAGAKNAETVFTALCTLLKMSDKTVFSYKTTKYATFKQLANDAADAFIAPVGYYLLERAKSNIDILVFASESPPAGDHRLELVNENAFIIINADDVGLQKYLKGTAANLLTYGFNPKASVTASSVEQSMEGSFIQLCIQRSFQALSGAIIEAQEIPLTFGARSVIPDEIAAITAALAIGTSIRTISLAY